MIEVYKCCGLKIERPPEDDKTEYHTRFACAACVISKPMLERFKDIPFQNTAKRIY